MANAILVDENISDGLKLVETLDDTDFPLNGALWYRFDELDQWRLLLISPLVDQIGTQATYRRLHESMQASGLGSRLHLGLDDITVVSPNNDLVKTLPPYRALQGTYDVHHAQSQQHLSSIQDAYVYRWEPPVGVALTSPWPTTIEDAVKQSVKQSLITLLGDGYPTKVTYDIDIQQVPNVPITLRRADTGESATGSINPLLPEALLGDGLEPMIYDVVRGLIEKLGLPT
jgi:hypothetical protein